MRECCKIHHLSSQDQKKQNNKETNAKLNLDPKVFEARVAHPVNGFGISKRPWPHFPGYDQIVSEYCKALLLLGFKPQRINMNVTV